MFYKTGPTSIPAPVESAAKYTIKKFYSIAKNPIEVENFRIRCVSNRKMRVHSENVSIFMQNIEIKKGAWNK